MTIPVLHRWPKNARAAIELQKRLAGGIALRPVSRLPRNICGVDAAFSRDGERVVAGAVVWDRGVGVVVEQRVARAPCDFPYIPGLLSFRELPAVIKALRAVRTPIDALICDAHGLAHPRRFGLACHLGLWINLPTIGCAKSRLCGEHTEPRGARGSTRQLVSKGERIGTVVRTRDSVKPLFVSPGHLCDHASAVRITLAAVTRYRLPEPTRLADKLVSRARVES